MYGAVGLINHQRRTLTEWDNLPGAVWLSPTLTQQISEKGVLPVAKQYQIVLVRPDAVVTIVISILCDSDSEGKEADCIYCQKSEL